MNLQNVLEKKLLSSVSMENLSEKDDDGGGSSVSMEISGGCCDFPFPGTELDLQRRCRCQRFFRFQSTPSFAGINCLRRNNNLSRLVGFSLGAGRVRRRDRRI